MASRDNIEQIRVGDVTLFKRLKGTTIIFAPSCGDPADTEQIARLTREVTASEQALEEATKELHDVKQATTQFMEVKEREAKFFKEVSEENAKLRRALEAERDDAPHLLQLIERFSERFEKCVDGSPKQVNRNNDTGVNVQTLISQARAFVGEWRALKKRLSESKPEGTDVG